ncbi:MAG: hypothetical protein HKO91_05685, partial [Desulfobacterales bacterium]|nr:hypothetical protein [Desulfobacterales bacterium]
MELLGVIFYFVIITGFGIAITGKLNLPSSQEIPAALILGSVILGVLLFFLCILQKINSTSITVVLVLSILLTIFHLKPLYYSFKAFFRELNTYIFSGKRYKYFYVLIIILLIVWYISLTWTPPRAADAMRYHLAQLKDIMQNGGLVFRPYYCYNFPMYFTTLFLPVYYLFGGIGVKFAHCFYFFSSVAIAVSLSSKMRIKNPILLISFFFLIPISFHEAHQVYNDWVLIFYMLAGMFFLVDRLKPNESFPVRIYLAFLSLGFALGVKYHAV